MNRITNFKSNLTDKEKEFLEEYEPAINEFLDTLKDEGWLNINFPEEQVDRIFKLIRSSNAPNHVFHNANKIFTGTEEEIKSNIEKLKELGLRVDTIAEQYGSVMCHTYQVMSERLKLHLVTLVNFSSMGLNNAYRKPLGPLIQKLKEIYLQNRFIQYLDTRIRNVVTHYTYFFANGVLNLCNGYFDPNPIPMQISDFVIETKRLNILTEAVFIIFLDKYKPNDNFFY